MSFAADIRADRQIARCESVEYAIERFSEQAAYHADVLLDELVRTGCMPHGFGGVDRNALIAAAGKAAVAAVLERANLPSGVVL